jgi:hypothetical protein
VIATSRAAYCLLCRAAPEVVLTYTATAANLRAYADGERFFAGLALLPPGLIRPSQWRPDSPDSPEEAARPSAAWVGVARKPAQRATGG